MIMQITIERESQCFFSWMNFCVPYHHMTAILYRWLTILVGNHWHAFTSHGILTCMVQIKFCSQARNTDQWHPEKQIIYSTVLRFQCLDQAFKNENVVSIEYWLEPCSRMLSMDTWKYLQTLNARRTLFECLGNIRREHQ